jgi:hypothetical protein
MKKEWLLLGLGLLILTFSVVCLLVFLLPGNPSVIKYKIKLGLLIISIQGVMTGCGSMGEAPPVECYAKPVTPEVTSCYAKPIPRDEISLETGEYRKGKHHITQALTDTLLFKVENRQSKQFFYTISDTNGTTVYTGVLMDLKSKPGIDLFAVPAIEQVDGSFELKIFTSDPSRKDITTAPIKVFELIIDSEERKMTVSPSVSLSETPVAGTIDKPDSVMIRCYLPPADLE